MSDEQNWEGAEEVQSNWFKFTAVGDRIKGTLMSKDFQTGTDGFSDQWIYEIRKEDGTCWNVGIAVTKKGTVKRMNNCKIGEIVGIAFDSEGEPPKKGFNAVKNLKIYSFGMDESYDEFDGADEVSTPTDTPELPPM